MDDPVWDELKRRNKDFGKTWNLFIKDLLKRKSGHPT